MSALHQKKGINRMHGLEWVFSIVLAVVFFLTGVNRAFRYEKARDLFPWVKDVPRALVQVIGIAEILGALESVMQFGLEMIDSRHGTERISK